MATTVVEGACASGGIAVRHGVLACKAGAARTVLCVGIDHMSSVATPVITAALSDAFDEDALAAGLTFAGYFGLVASAYAARYGPPRKHLTSVVVQNRTHGDGNELAMFSQAVAAENVETARIIADSLRLMDCAPIAAAYRKHARPAESTGAGHSGDAARCDRFLLLSTGRPSTFLWGGEAPDNSISIVPIVWDRWRRKGQTRRRLPRAAA